MEVMIKPLFASIFASKNLCNLADVLKYPPEFGGRAVVRIKRSLMVWMKPSFAFVWIVVCGEFCNLCCS